MKFDVEIKNLTVSQLEMERRGEIDLRRRWQRMHVLEQLFFLNATMFFLMGAQLVQPEPSRMKSDQIDFCTYRLSGNQTKPNKCVN